MLEKALCPEYFSFFSTAGGHKREVFLLRMGEYSCKIDIKKTHQFSHNFT